MLFSGSTTLLSCNSYLALPPCLNMLGMEAILRLAVPLISHDEEESLPEEDMLGTPVNYIDTKAKCRHLKKLTFKGTCRQLFIRVCRLVIQVSHVSIFDSSL